MSFFLAFALSILSSISLCSKRGVVTKQLTQGKSLGAGRVQVLTVKKIKIKMFYMFHFTLLILPINLSLSWVPSSMKRIIAAKVIFYNRGFEI